MEDREKGEVAWAADTTEHEPHNHERVGAIIELIV